MNSNKSLLKLIQDLRVVADDLQIIADADSNDGPEPVKQDENKTTESEKEPGKTIRLEDVRAVLAAKSREGYGDNIRDLISKFGAERLSKVDPSHYAEILKEVEALGNAT
jgi:hypothetical protein